MDVNEDERRGILQLEGRRGGGEAEEKRTRELHHTDIALVRSLDEPSLVEFEDRSVPEHNMERSVQRSRSRAREMVMGMKIGARGSVAVWDWRLAGELRGNGREEEYSEDGEVVYD